MTPKAKLYNCMIKWILTLVAVLCLAPLAAHAQATEEYVASVTFNGETVYHDSLDSAIADAQEKSGSTLTLLKDVDKDVYKDRDRNVVIDKGNFTFDLNGHTIEAYTKFLSTYLKQSVLNINAGATIKLIGDGAIISDASGVGEADTTHFYCIRNAGNLTIDGTMQLRTIGTTSYNHGIYNYQGTLTIQNCNINVRRNAVQCYSGAQATINGGFFEGDVGVWPQSNSNVTINGGSFDGTSYDLIADTTSTIQLGVGTNGTGAVFPGGLSAGNSRQLHEFLSENYYYARNNNPVDMTDVSAEITGGDVSVRYCDHSQNTNDTPIADDASTHSLFCGICGVCMTTENHEWTNTICTECGYGCTHPSIVTENGVTKCADCVLMMVAKVGDDQYFTTLSEAVAQANGSTLTLLSDVKEDITIPSGSSFTLDLNGKTLRGTGTKSVITIESGSRLTMKDSGSGGKVTGLDDRHAKGAIQVIGNFTMQSGAISGNKADRGGGVFVSGNGIFTMEGGEITGNTAHSYGGGVALVDDGTFTMNGGSITNNTATGDDKNMEIEGLMGGGGVHVYASSDAFTMNGGTISGNSCPYTRGGGVHLSAGTFQMNGGSITGNTAAKKGGGIYVSSVFDYSRSFTVDGASSVYNNLVNGSPNNVYLDSPLTLAIGANVSANAQIGISSSAAPTAAAGVEIASSGATDANQNAFTSDNVSYAIQREDNKLYLYPQAHNWVYEAVGGNTIKATCSDAACTTPNGGSVKLVMENTYYTGNALKASTEGGFANGATIHITYDDGATTAPSELGNHSVKLTVRENNTEKKSVEIAYTITYLPVPVSPYQISGYTSQNGNAYWFEPGTSATITPPVGYTISSTLYGPYQTALSLTENDDQVIYLKNSSGEMTGAIRMTEALNFGQPPSPEATDATGTSAVPKTGDHSNLGLWSSLLFVSSMGIIALSFNARKKQQKNVR